METARGNPPDRRIADDDVVFLDFGPIFEEWEADFGRTYVLGNDPRKLALCEHLPQVWQAGHDYFHRSPDITGERLFEYVAAVSRDFGWDFGGVIAGHLVGEFPHDKIEGEAYRLLHRTRINTSNAAKEPLRQHMSLDPRSALGRSGPSVRRFLRRASRHSLTERGAYLS